MSELTSLRVQGNASGIAPKAFAEGVQIGNQRPRRRCQPPGPPLLATTDGVVMGSWASH
jgi:hypothetical protein